jgi:hypothetical protein
MNTRTFTRYTTHQYDYVTNSKITKKICSIHLGTVGIEFCLKQLIFLRQIWCSRPITRLLRKRLQIRSPHNTNMCVHEQVCFYWFLIFSMYNKYVFTNKKYISMFKYLESNTHLINAHFGLDNRECVSKILLLFLFSRLQS